MTGEGKGMDEKISRRNLIKRSIRVGLAAGGLAVVGAAGYKLFRGKSIDDI